MSFLKPTKEEKLIKAIRKNDTLGVKNLLADGASLLQAQQQDPSLMARAIVKAPPLLLDICFESGQVDVSAEATLGMFVDGVLKVTKGHHFFEYSHIFFPLMEKLKAVGADFRGVDPYRKGLLHLAIDSATTSNFSDLPDLLEFLPAHILPEMLTALDVEGRTPLHCMIEFSHVQYRGELCKTFVKMGADPSIRDRRGRSCLDIAYARNFREIISFLQRPALLLEAPSAPAPAPAAVEVLPKQEPSPWINVSEREVACVREFKELGYKITDIFNFAAGERLSLSQNLATKVESRETTRFELIWPNLLEEAFDAYARNGGRIGREEALRTAVPLGLEKPAPF